MACYEDPSNYGVVGNCPNPTNQRHGSRAAILEKGKELFPESRLRYNGSGGRCVGPVVIFIFFCKGSGRPHSFEVFGRKYLSV